MFSECELNCMYIYSIHKYCSCDGGGVRSPVLHCKAPTQSAGMEEESQV